MAVRAPEDVVFNSTKTALLPPLATTRSGLPSPLTSTAATDCGAPAVNVCCAAKLGALAPGAAVLNSTETVPLVPFATTRSGMPSPLTSATATPVGPLPVANATCAAKLGVADPGDVVFSRTEMELLTVFTAIRSGLPSPFTSATATACGPVPTVNVCAAAKLKVPAPIAVVLRNTDSVPLPRLATITSSLPSPLTSPTATPYGSVPVANVCGAANVVVVAPNAVVSSSTENVLSLEFTVITSGRPSALRSAAMIFFGWLPVAYVCCAAKLDAPEPRTAVFRSTEIVLSLRLFATTSGLPSPLRSATPMPATWLPTAKGTAASKLTGLAPGVVVLNNTATALPVPYPTTRSSRPSPFRSAAASAPGCVPMSNACGAAKLGVPAPALVLMSTATVVPGGGLPTSETTMSGLPSPFMSAAMTRCGPAPVAKVCEAAKLAVAAPDAVVFNSTATTLFTMYVTMRSGLPSPSTSATVTDIGKLPLANVCGAANVAVLAPAGVVFKNTETSLSRKFTTTMSGLPSPFRSVAATQVGSLPTLNVCCVKVCVAAPGAVVFSSTEMLLLPSFGTMTSTLPSPFKSANATAFHGPVPTAKVCWAAKFGPPVGSGVVFSSADTVLSPLFATSKSSLPSPLMSAAMTAPGCMPAPNDVPAAKLGIVAPGAVVFSSTDSVFEFWFATIKSGLPSPFTSALVTELGALPAAKVCCPLKVALDAPGAVVLTSTETLPLLASATITSGRPSPLRSAALTELGALPVANVCCAAKLGVAAPGAVVLSSTDTVLSRRFATIRSGLPSPLTSAAATERGRLPAAKS